MSTRLLEREEDLATLSAALETTNLRPESPINCHNGVLTLFGRTIHDSHGGNGILPMAMVLAKSSLAIASLSASVGSLVSSTQRARRTASISSRW